MDKLRRMVSFILVTCLTVSCISLASCVKEEKATSLNITYEYFKADITDVPVGEKTQVIYTVKVLSDEKVNKISVVDSDGKRIGNLLDDGNNSDHTKDDQVFTGKFELFSDTQKHQYYYAEIGTDKSETIDTFFYNRLTDEDFDKLESTVQSLHEIEKRYLDQEGYVPRDMINSVLKDIYSYVESMNGKGEVKKYELGSESVYFELSNGIGHIFVPKQRDTLSSGEAKRIVTVEPFAFSLVALLGDFFTWITKEKYELEYQGGYGPDDNAEMIQDSLNEYSYNREEPVLDARTQSGFVDADDDHFIEDEVNIDAIKQIAGSKILIWEGHGAHSDEIGSVLVTKEDATKKKNIEKYSADLQDKRIITTGGWQTLGTDYIACDYCVTSKFFDHYFSKNSLQDCTVFLGACYSGQDDKLAKSLINKGANSVYSVHGKTTPDYEMLMRTTIFYQLLQKDSSGLYKTTHEALESAMAFDSGNKEIYIILNTKDGRKDLRLSDIAEVRIDNSDSEKGTTVLPPTDVSTKNEITSATVETETTRIPTTTKKIETTTNVPDYTTLGYPTYPTTQKYWIIFREGYRGNRIEMSTFDSTLPESSIHLIWNTNIMLSDTTGASAVEQYCLEDGKWVKIGTYRIPTDYATKIIASNMNVYDQNGHLLFSKSEYGKGYKLD